MSGGWAEFFLSHPLALGLAVSVWIIGVCCRNKKNEPTRKSTRKSGSVKNSNVADESSATNPTQESRKSRKDMRAALVHLTPQRTQRTTRTARTARDKTSPREKREQGPSPRRKKPSPRLDSIKSTTNVSHTAKRTTTTTTKRSSGERVSTTGKKALHHSSPRRSTLPKRKKSVVRSSWTEREKNCIEVSHFDLTPDTPSEDSEIMRHRMTFPADPYKVRKMPSYVAPDGRVLTPRIKPLSGKEREIHIRKEFRRETEYPTYEDIKSMWDTVEDKERTEGKKRPSSSDTPSVSMRTSDESKERVGGGIPPVPYNRGPPRSSADGEEC